jgi:hypothetical protein
MALCTSRDVNFNEKMQHLLSFQVFLVVLFNQTLAIPALMLNWRSQVEKLN